MQKVPCLTGLRRVASFLVVRNKMGGLCSLGQEILTGNANLSGLAVNVKRLLETIFSDFAFTLSRTNPRVAFGNSSAESMSFLINAFSQPSRAGNAWYARPFRFTSFVLTNTLITTGSMLAQYHHIPILVITAESVNSASVKENLLQDVEFSTCHAKIAPKPSR